MWNYSEPHAVTDHGEALSSLRLKFSFTRRSEWCSLVRCGHVGKDDGNSGMQY